MGTGKLLVSRTTREKDRPETTKKRHLAFSWIRN
jgi:hypothetical protein